MLSMYIWKTSVMFEPTTICVLAASLDEAYRLIAEKKTLAPWIAEEKVPPTAVYDAPVALEF